MEAKQKIRSSQAVQPLADDASDDEVAAWREANGVPSEPKGYFEGLPDGLVIGEEDQAGMDVLAESMHGVNASSKVTQAAIGAYYKHVENVLAEQAEADKAQARDFDDWHNETYGKESRGTRNDMDAWLGTAGEEVRASFLGARLPDGTLLGNSPEIMRWMTTQLREVKPVVTVTGLGAGDPAAALNDEIASIENKMRTNFKEYDRDPKMKARYEELLRARDGA